MFQYPSPVDDEARARWGVGEHCDYGVLTILLQDEVGGLEVRSRNGEWLSAKPIPGSFVVNIGDMLERLTWGRLAVCAECDRLVASVTCISGFAGIERRLIASAILQVSTIV